MRAGLSAWFSQKHFTWLPVFLKCHSLDLPALPSEVWYPSAALGHPSCCPDGLLFWFGLFMRDSPGYAGFGLVDVSARVQVPKYKI